MRTAALPNRAVFRSQDVCDIAQVQPYVLRSWEAEFPDLGLSKTVAGPRIYRQSDVERVLRLKHLLFVEGLTLAGARRQLSEEGPPARATDDDAVSDADVAAILDGHTRQGLRDVRQGLQWILAVLNGRKTPFEEFRLVAAPVARNAQRKHAPPAKPAKRVKSRVAARSARAKMSKPAKTSRKLAGRKKR